VYSSIKKVPPFPPEKSGITVRGNQFTLTYDVFDRWFTCRGTFKVDPTRRPKQVEVTLTEGPDKGETCLGIYEFKGGTCTGCLARPGGRKRPTKFTSEEGTLHLLAVVKRKAN
jgi:uncharacterized protein (TIGR03067 family)